MCSSNQNWKLLFGKRFLQQSDWYAALVVDLVSQSYVALDKLHDPVAGNAVRQRDAFHVVRLQVLGRKDRSPRPALSRRADVEEKFR